MNKHLKKNTKVYIFFSISLLTIRDSGKKAIQEREIIKKRIEKGNNCFHKVIIYENLEKTSYYVFESKVGFHFKPLDIKIKEMLPPALKQRFEVYEAYFPRQAVLRYECVKNLDHKDFKEFYLYSNRKIPWGYYWIYVDTRKVSVPIDLKMS